MPISEDINQYIGHFREQIGKIEGVRIRLFKKSFM